jgi:hypothetical protein
MCSNNVDDNGKPDLVDCFWATATEPLLCECVVIIVPSMPVVAVLTNAPFLFSQLMVGEIRQEKSITRSDV